MDDNFDLWTKQNIIDIIFNFNEKNYKLLRKFIKWYDIESNYIYILSSRYFYSNECLKLLLSTINAFIDVKNNDISEEIDINDTVNDLEKYNETDITKEVNINELEKYKEIDIIEEDNNDNELKKKNDNDEYVVINDDYYLTKDIIKKEDVEKEDVEEEDVDEEDVNEKDVNEEDVNQEDVDEEDVEEEEDVNQEDVDEEDVDEEDVEEDVNQEDVDEEDVDKEYNNLIINKFSNNEIILLLNILEEDTKKFTTHNYIIGKCKEEIFFYNNFYLGFTAGIFVYFLLKLL